MTTSTTAPMAGRTQGRRETRARRHSNVTAAATRSAKRGERGQLWHLIADECAEYGVRFR